MTTPVSFSIAKLLKEKGFDVEDRKRYQMYGSQSIPQLERYSEVRWNLYKDYYLAPTIADVIMWLYEKHGIWISVQRDWDIGQCLGFEAIIDDNSGIINTPTFNTPTEAYEAAIKFCLTKLV